MSLTEAAPQQSLDGLTAVTAMYGAGLKLDQSVSTVHAVLDAMPELWTCGELAEDLSINVSYQRLGLRALEDLRGVERRGREKRDGSHQRLILFGATELLVDAAVDLNHLYLDLIGSNKPDMEPVAIKHEAVGLLAVKHALPAETPPKDVIRVASRHRSEHPTHTAYHMLELFVKEHGLGKRIEGQMLRQVQAHPLFQNSRRARRNICVQERLSAQRSVK